MKRESWLFFVFGTIVFFLKGENCLRINDLLVPNVVENGSEEDVVLDCDYSFENSDPSGLVVKWFLNDGETPVYQWIPPKLPQDFGKLKLAAKYRMTPLSTYQPMQSLHPNHFDFSRLPEQPSPQDLREYLVAQLERESRPLTPPQNDLQSLKNLIALKNLKALKTGNQPDVSHNVANWHKVIGQSNIATSLTQLLTDSLARTEKAKVEAQPSIFLNTPNISNLPLKLNKEKQPQICIQFIDLSSQAVETLLNRNQKINSSQNNIEPKPTISPTSDNHQNVQEPSQKISEQPPINNQKSINSENVDQVRHSAVTPKSSYMRSFGDISLTPRRTVTAVLPPPVDDNGTNEVIPDLT